MLRGVRPAITGLCLLSLCGTAFAEQPYYYNKPGVVREAFLKDVAECNDLAMPVKGPNIITYSSNIYAAAIGGFFAGWMKSAERRRIRRTVERTCMADKGYIRIEADDSLEKDFDHLADDKRLEKLLDLAGQATPPGKRLSE